MSKYNSVKRKVPKLWRNNRIYSGTGTGGGGSAGGGGGVSTTPSTDSASYALYAETAGAYSGTGLTYIGNSLVIGKGAAGTTWNTYTYNVGIGSVDADEQGGLEIYGNTSTGKVGGISFHNLAASDADEMPVEIYVNRGDTDQEGILKFDLADAAGDMSTILTLNSSGIQSSVVSGYSSDLSSQFTDRSWVDVGYLSSPTYTASIANEALGVRWYETGSSFYETISSSIQLNHDSLKNYVIEEHLDWTVDVFTSGGYDIHVNNITEVDVSALQNLPLLPSGLISSSYQEVMLWAQNAVYAETASVAIKTIFEETFEYIFTETNYSLPTASAYPSTRIIKNINTGSLVWVNAEEGATMDWEVSQSIAPASALHLVAQTSMSWYII